MITLKCVHKRTIGRFIHRLLLAARQALSGTLKQHHGYSLRVSEVLECGEKVRQTDTPLIWLDANLCIQELSCALLKDKMASRCAILFAILCTESLN